MLGEYVFYDHTWRTAETNVRMNTSIGEKLKKNNDIAEVTFLKKLTFPSPCPLKSNWALDPELVQGTKTLLRYWHVVHRPRAFFFFSLHVIKTKWT